MTSPHNTKPIAPGIRATATPIAIASSQDSASSPDPTQPARTLSSGELPLSSTALVSGAKPPIPGNPQRSRARPIAVPDAHAELTGSGFVRRGHEITDRGDDDNEADEDEEDGEDDDLDDLDEDEDDEPFLGLAQASPGGPDSWRGMPPPMLASSFDVRYRPPFRHVPSSTPSSPSTTTTATTSHPSTTVYGAAVTLAETPTETTPPAPDSKPSSQADRCVLESTPSGRTTLDPSTLITPDSDIQLIAARTISDLGLTPPPHLGLDSGNVLEQSTAPDLVTPLITPHRQKQHQRMYHHPKHHPSSRPPHLDHVHPPWKVKVSKLSAQWSAILHAPRELGIIFLLKFLSSYAYFALSLILTMFLTEEFGLSDSAAGWSYGLYGVMSTIFGFACGWIIDYLGVRVSLLVGGVVGAASRLVLALTPSHRTAKLMLYTALPFSECLGIPIMTIGIKRYTTSRNRTFAYSIFYSMMNVAALLVGPIVDMARRSFSRPVVLDLRYVGFEATFELGGLRIIVLSSAIASAAMLLGVIAGIREIEVDDHGNISSFEPNRNGPVGQTWNVLRQPSFWRLTVFTLLIVGVRLVFRHVDATLPKYLIREFGPDAPFGAIYAINPFMVIWLVPLVGLFSRSVDSFSMILSGSFISALSPFWVCVGQHYWCVVMFMVFLSIGEAIYSPRVYEYTMEVAGRGSEGLYSSLSSAPLFSVKLLVGGMSGWLLTSFMPADAPEARNGRLLWAIVGVTSMTSPVFMSLLRGYLTHQDGENHKSSKLVCGSDAYVPIGETGNRATTS